MKPSLSFREPIHIEHRMMLTDVENTFYTQNTYILGTDSH